MTIVTPATIASRVGTKRVSLPLALLIICLLLQAQPAFTFGGFTLAKPINSGSSIAERPKSDAAISPSGAVGRISPVLERITAAPKCSGVSISRRFDWVLRGKYDSLEEAIAYARAQAGRGPDLEEGNDKDESSSGETPEATVEKAKGEPDSNTAKPAVAKPKPTNKESKSSKATEKKDAPEDVSAMATEKVTDKIDVKEPIKAEAVNQEMKEELEGDDLDVVKEAPGSDSSDAPATGKKMATTGKKTKQVSSGWSLFDVKPKEQTSNLALSKPETVVVVTGATGRVGQLAVRRILELYDRVLVRAVVTDYSKGLRVLREEQDTYGVKLEIMAADLQSMRSAGKVVAGASAVVFCASGFAQSVSVFQRLANAVRLALNPKSVAEIEGVKFTALALKSAKKSLPAKRAEAGQTGLQDENGELKPLFPNAPRFVMLSSAAVTRPQWSSEEKALYPLAAEIPIVKLNPLNILNIKAEGEQELRKVGIPYTVVRPCGLNDDHPRGRPLFSVGDTAAGRICREDVADVLARCLGTPEATGKTFEVQALPGLDKVASSGKNKAGIDRALANLPTDKDFEKDPELLKNIRQATYPVLTQLRPVPLTQTTEQQD